MKRHLSFLEAIGCGEATHSGRTLSQHLNGTYEILKLWDAPKYVCLAGLFHSVYGTVTFNTSCLSYADRPVVAKLIGQKAELLAFFFSFFTIDDLLSAESSKGKMLIYKNEFSVELTLLQYIQLAEISIANFIEQYGHVPKVDAKTIDKFRRLVNLQRKNISPKAYTEFKLKVEKSAV